MPDLVPKLTDPSEMVFNKDYYKAKTETEVSKDMQYILTIPPEARTDEQIKFVRNGLQKLTALAEYPINMQEKICRCAFYQKVPIKRIIIRQGQLADNFYFIISGQAVVTVMDEKSTDPIGRIVAVLKHGTCFGELAFLYNSTRTATVSSLTDLEMISICREDFFDIFMSNKGQEPEHIKFLRTCPFVNNWPIEKLLENPKNCLFHYYKKGEIILKTTLKCDWIFVVKSGSCQVIKRLEEVNEKTHFYAKKPREITEYQYLLAPEIKSKTDTRLKINEKKKQNFVSWAFTNADESRSNIGTAASSKENHQPISRAETRPVFLQVQLLKEGETFGLNLLKLSEHDDSELDPELSLISNGAEILMLDKEYFLKHANDEVRTNIRRIIQNYPPREEMQSKLQVKADWKQYKKKTLQDLYTNINIQKAHKNSKSFF